MPMNEGDPQEKQSHQITRASKSKKIAIAKQKREAAQTQHQSDLTTVIKTSGDELSLSDQELVDGLSGIAKRQGQDLVAQLEEEIPSAYYEGISESIREGGLSAMRDNFRKGREDFSARLAAEFGIS